MTTTANVALTAGAWTLLASGSANVAVQGAPGGFRVYIGPSAPGGANNGMVVNDATGTFAASALVAGDNVYAFPVNAAGEAGVVVIKS